MFKNIPKFFFIFFFLINFNQVFAESKFNIFNSNIDLISLHSFYDKEKKIINWSDSFVLISQTQNIKKYNLENKIFKIERTIIFKNKKIEVNDKYINKLNKKIGIISNYKIANKNISQFYASGIKIKKKIKK